jgi:hypothetical protein
MEVAMSKEQRFRCNEGQYELIASESDDDALRISRLSRWIGGALLACLLVLLFSGLAQAHHEPQHRVLVLGEQTQVNIRLLICDEMEQMMEVAKQETRDELQVVLRKYYTMLNAERESVCAVVTTQFVPLELMHQTEQFGNEISIISLLAPDGNIYYGLIVNVPVVSKEEAYLNDSSI